MGILGGGIILFFIVNGCDKMTGLFRRFTTLTSDFYQMH